MVTISLPKRVVEATKVAAHNEVNSFSGWIRGVLVKELRTLGLLTDATVEELFPTESAEKEAS